MQTPAWSSPDHKLTEANILRQDMDGGTKATPARIRIRIIQLQKSVCTLALHTELYACNLPVHKKLAVKSTPHPMPHIS